MEGLAGGYNGSCRCGEVGFRADGRPLITMACHCGGCRRMTGSAFSVSALYPEDRFEVTRGTPVVGGLRAAALPHLFCPNCMSWLFTRPGGLPGLVNVRCTLLDDGAETVPFIETCVSERLAWATTPAIHAFARFPSPDQWPGLLTAYAAKGC